MQNKPGRTKVGWIGTGIMGSAMASHLIEAGYSLRVHNRTEAKADSLLKAGAQWADTPKACAADADVVFTIVGFPADVEEVHLGAAGVVQSVRAGTIVVDMTTSSPSLARKLAEAYAARGASSLDAPVSGGDVGAREGCLAIMVGGDVETFDAVAAMLGLMGENIALMGPTGAGQHTKMCNQILIAGTIIGVCESLLYAAGAGLDSRAVIEIIGRGAAGCWSISNLGPRIVSRDFAPGFIVEHFIKDMGIALAEAEAMGLSLPGLALVDRLYRDLADIGGGRDGTQALIKVLAKNVG